MRILIRIVFVIFIANGIDSLGGVCNDCCDCFKEKGEEESKKGIGGKGGENNDKKNDEEDKKEDEKNDEENNEDKKEEEIKEYEEIKEDEKNTAKSLVNENWYEVKEKNKENNLVLKIFKKKNDDAFPSKENGDKISIKLDEKGNPKIADQNGEEDPLNLQDKKYAFFEIKTKDENTIYLYCSDIESVYPWGLFNGNPHVGISVIACDTENVTNLVYMFNDCSSLTEIDLNNFDTTKVTDMRYMFYYCKKLENLNISSFNTSKVTNMESMFTGCCSLTILNISNFDTTNVTNMDGMFWGCKNLTDLKIEKNFNNTKVTTAKNMFRNCINLPKDIQSNLNNVEGIIKFFKEKNN